MDIQELIDDGINELKEWIEKNPENEEPHDQIFEIADSQIPVYNSDLLELANNDSSLATNTPTLGPAFDGSSTPINIIAANVFEAIENGLWEFWNNSVICRR